MRRTVHSKTFGPYEVTVVHGSFVLHSRDYSQATAIVEHKGGALTLECRTDSSLCSGCVIPAGGGEPRHMSEYNMEDLIVSAGIPVGSAILIAAYIGRP